ncbi:hypothetical protein ACNIS8_27205, partial [Escherichia coli]
SAQIREILINESAWEEMTCLFAPSLTLGMMMMSPVTISTPIKLILFVAMDGWTMLSKGLILQYFDLSINP